MPPSRPCRSPWLRARASRRSVAWRTKAFPGTSTGPTAMRRRSAARLEVEANGRAVQAIFRPEQGDYLIADSAWLAPLRQPGEQMLALTVMAARRATCSAPNCTSMPAPGAGPGRAGYAGRHGRRGRRAGRPVLAWPTQDERRPGMKRTLLAIGLFASSLGVALAHEGHDHGDAEARFPSSASSRSACRTARYLFPSRHSVAWPC